MSVNLSRVRWLPVLVGGALICASCTSEIVETSEIDGDLTAEALMWAEWPLTVDPVEAECWRDGAVTLRTEDGTRYALNGRARAQMDEREWSDISEVAKPGDGVLGASENLDELLSFAVDTICGL